MIIHHTSSYPFSDVDSCPFLCPPSFLHSMVTPSPYNLYMCSYFHERTHLILGDGDVYVWDMQTKKCKHKFRDEGCVKGTCIDVSKNGRLVACG